MDVIIMPCSELIAYSEVTVSQLHGFTWYFFSTILKGMPSAMDISMYQIFVNHVTNRCFKGVEPKSKS